MKFTLSWLEQHLDTEAPLDEIAERLTMLGLEVEDVRDQAADLADFTVARVISAEPHPDADRLRVCLVDTGSEKVQVVCGAPNARAGMKGVFAPAGVTVPGTGLHLKKTKIRGVESNGMLCSEREMGLSDEHEGIIELADDAPVGAPFAAAAGLDDPLIEIAITPNRQDCLGVHGIARDLAAAGLGALKPFDTAPVAGSFKSPLSWKRDLPKGKEDACPLVVGRYFRNLENGPSPKWLRGRLEAIGLRPISALVDITNWVTLDLGRPLHVFDADKLAGDLSMRMARKGEKILALDGGEYALDDEMVVIADADSVHGIGGVMGGEATGCTEKTTNMFLEVALFDPVRVAATGRRLGIESDARYRFERGVDPESALWGAEVAARLVLELCGGEASETVSAGDMPDWRRTVALRPARVAALGGVEVNRKEQQTILERLGFTLGDTDDEIQVQVPSWRRDIDGEADLVEEIVRVHGYDRIAAVALPRERALPAVATTQGQRRLGRARRVLAGRGMLEAVTWSFVDAAGAKLFGGGDAALRLANPISADLEIMRPSILPNLIAAAGRNADRGFRDISLFEAGPQYRNDTAEGQATVIAGLRAGMSGPRHWDRSSWDSGPWARGQRPVDAFDAKADALAALAAAGAPVDKLRITSDAPAWYHPGKSGSLRLGANVLAWFGDLNPRILGRLDVAGPMAGFEIMLAAIPTAKARAGKARKLLLPSSLQPVVRDFAFIVGDDVTADSVVRAARNAEKDLIAEVTVFDLYVGEGVGEERKSLAIAVTLQPREKTLTDAEIDAVARKIVANVEKVTGGKLRA